MTIAHHAQAKSENFSYEAYGSTPDAARDALLEGLHGHAEELDLEPGWPDEMIAKCVVSSVAAGTSRIETFDLSVAGREVARIDMAGDVAWRSYCEMKLPGLDWGYVDGHGPTEDQARQAMMAGVDAMMALGAASGLARDEILADAETYPVRDGGAYRGGMVQSAGEPLLDAHLPPVLPDRFTEWFPTVLCTLEVVTGKEVIARAEATARPSRQNQLPVISFFENNLQTANAQLLDGIADAELRAATEAVLNPALSDLVVVALMSRRGEPLCRRIDLKDGSGVIITFIPRPTTAESLVVPRT